MRYVIALLLLWASAASATDAGEAIMNSMDGAHLPRGTVVYKNLRDMPAPVQAAVRADDAKLNHLTTRSGVTYRAAIVDDAILQLISAEEAKAKALKSPAPHDKAALKSGNLKEKASLAEATSEGAPVARYTRVYEDESRQLLVQRWDLSVDKGSVMVIRDFCNVDVNGSPGVFAAYVARSGGAVYNVSWTTPTQRFEMHVKGFADADAALDYMLAAARSM